MTKTLNKIIYSIKESIYNYHITDEADIIDDIIKAKIIDINTVLMKQYFTEKFLLDGFYQRIPCIEIECEKESCVNNGITLFSGNLLWKAKLPNLNHVIGDLNIRYLGLGDLKNEFVRMSLDGFRSVKGRLWTGYKTYYTIIGEYAYFNGLPTSGIKYITLIGILVNPTTACNWSDDISIFPTPDPYKLELLVKQDLLSTKGIGKDEEVDSRDSSEDRIQKK